MKTTTLITFFAAASTLIAETNSPAPTLLTNTAPLIQVDLVEQARLVAEIGQEAAKGFDAETHARSLRAQIEALLTKPAPAKPDTKADAVENTAPPTTAPAITPPAATATPATTSFTGPDPAALKEAIALLRREADRLEAQLQKLSRQP